MLRASFTRFMEFTVGAPRSPGLTWLAEQYIVAFSASKHIISCCFDEPKATQNAGIARAKQKEDLYRGRKPSFDRMQFDVVVDLIGEGMGVSEIAKVSALSCQTIYRIKDDVARSEKSLAVWGI